MEMKPTLLVSGTIAFAQVENVSLIVSTLPKWTRENTEDFIMGCERVTGLVHAPRANVTHFIGDAPGPITRKHMLEVLERIGQKPAPRSAVLTDSSMLRQMMIAWTWLTGADARAFPPGERREALEWAGAEVPYAVAGMESALIACYRALGLIVPLARPSVRP